MDKLTHQKLPEPSRVHTEELIIPKRIQKITGKPGSLLTQTTVSLFTSFANRAFRKHFYFLSVNIYDQRNDEKSMARMNAGQKEFLHGIEVMRKTQAHWPHLDNTLTEKTYVGVVAFTPQCARLSQLFVTTDRFLIAPYMAKISGLISQADLNEISEEVDLLLKELYSSMHSKRPDVARPIPLD